MTEQQIETLLRKAPRATPPEGLLARVQNDIRLPRRPGKAMVQPASVLWLRRRLPMLGFAGGLVACVVVFAVQSSKLSELRTENETLRAATQNLERLRRDNAEYQRLQAENQELERLRKDSQELTQLRAEVARLRGQVEEVNRLRVANQQLAAGVRPQLQTQANEEFFAQAEDAKAKAQSMACVNNLKQIGLAARIWATDNGDVLPPNWLAMTNELATPKILVCPGDPARAAAQNWASLSAANVSYEYLNPNGSEADPYVILTRCTVHGHVGLSDGSVMQGGGLGKTFTIAVRDGKQVFTALNPPANSDPQELMRQRYGLQPGAGLVAPGQPKNLKFMSEEMLRRYGLPTNINMSEEMARRFCLIPAAPTNTDKLPSYP